MTMITVVTNFELFQINIARQAWQPPPDKFTWQLRLAARITLQLSTRNLKYAVGEPSIQELCRYYRGTLKPPVKENKFAKTPSKSNCESLHIH